MDSWRLIIRKTGGPDVIEREPFDPGTPGPGEALVAHEAAGLNFIDTYFRAGLYPMALPATLGNEGAGIVMAVGDAVSNVTVGDRVGYATGSTGSYATHAIVKADRLLILPDVISFETAAATMLKGMTAAALVTDCAKVQPGQVVLVHAAAGGVGSILVPWLDDLGAIVIAHSGSPGKAARATAMGAQHSLCGDMASLTETVRDLTGGNGVDVVFDGVGKDSWAASIASLKRRGLMISYGNASGAVPPFSVMELSRGGSLFLTRPTLFDYIREDADLARIGGLLFDQIASGVITADIGQRFALENAADAHRALEARETTGSTVLTL